MNGLRGDDPIRVLVADSQAVIRSGVRLAVEEQPDMRVTGEAADLAEALRSVAAQRPEVAVVELELPGGDGETAVGALTQRRDLTIILLAGADDPDLVAAALAAEPRAVLSKTAPMANLIDAIRSVRQADRWQPPSAEARLRARSAEWSGLTSREVEVAGLVARGLSYRDIASRLGISEHTVKNHLRRIYDKLDINSRVELAVHAARP